MKKLKDLWKTTDKERDNWTGFYWIDEAIKRLQFPANREKFHWRDDNIFTLKGVIAEELTEIQKKHHAFFNEFVHQKYMTHEIMMKFLADFHDLCLAVKSEHFGVCSRCGTILEHGGAQLYDKKHRVKEHLCIKCDKKDRLQTYAKDRVIYSGLLCDAAICKARGEYGKDASWYSADERELLKEISESSELVHAEAKRFERDFWFPKLQAIAIAANHGLSGTNGKFKVMMMGSAGRSLITFQDAYNLEDPKSQYGGAWVTLITEEASKESRMGVQGMAATKDEALRLLKDGMADFPELTPEKLAIG